MFYTTIHPELVASAFSGPQDFGARKNSSVIHQKRQELAQGRQAELGLEPNLCGFQSTPYHTEEMKCGVNCVSLFS